MIKFIAATIWICIATIGAVFYSFQAAGARGEAEPPKPMLGGLDYIKTEIISVPLVRNSTVEGYLLTKLVYTVDPAQIAKLSIPADALITDQVYSYLYTNPQIDFANKASLDINAFRDKIRDAINARVGEKMVHEVLVEQIDFLTKDDIRDSSIRRKKGMDPKPR